MVASQHQLASEIGADVLRRGGNAVDAAVATGLALGVVEPWMSGIGGGGYMTVQRTGPGPGRDAVVEFGMRAPLGASAADYPLAEGVTGPATFNWPAVADDANVAGPLAIAVPGHVKGLALALARFGTWEWRDVIAPACELAEAGLPVDWHATLLIASQARGLARFAETRRVFLPDGLPPVAAEHGRLPLGNLADTYRTLRDDGPESFYQGELAARIAADLSAAGSRIRLADLGAYTARVAEPMTFAYRDAQVVVPGPLTAGPTLARTLGALAQRPRPPNGNPDADAFVAFADALLEAYRYRLAHLGEGEAPGDTHTSHICVADRRGEMVSLTQTILSGFGARIMLPATGILMNNGMMWFDPRPGGPNAVAGGRRPLCNMCPVIVTQADGSRFAVGACGGRRILAAVAQLIVFLVDYGMSVDDAVHHPRIDVSGTDLITIMANMPTSIAARLRAKYPRTETRQNGVGGGLFALPQLVKREPDGTLAGGCFVPSPTARVVAA